VQAGVPLLHDESAGESVVRLVDADRWRIGVPLGVAEIVALHVAADTLHAGGGAFLEAARSALEKLDAAVPGKLLARMDEALSGVSVSTRGRRGYESRPEIVATLMQAVNERRPLDLSYATPGRERPVARRVHPLVMRLESGAAYLVAFDLSHGEVRTFLVDRVRMATLGDGRFEPPEGFDVEAYFADAFRVYRGGAKVKLRAVFSARVAHLLEERPWHPSQKLRRVEDGVELRMDVADSPELRAWLLSFGGDVAVVAPKALASALVGEAERMVRGYAMRRGREKRGGAARSRAARSRKTDPRTKEDERE